MGKKSASAEPTRWVLTTTSLDPEMTAAFVQSVSNFTDRLLLLKRALDGKFDHHTADGGQSHQERWNPPEHFNLQSFAWQCQKTHEAWHVAKGLNAELNAFDGETILALCRVFEIMHRREHGHSPDTEPPELSVTRYRFEHEIERFQLRTTLKATRPIAGRKVEQPAAVALATRYPCWDSVSLTLSTSKGSWPFPESLGRPTRSILNEFEKALWAESIPCPVPKAQAVESCRMLTGKSDTLGLTFRYRSHDNVVTCTAHPAEVPELLEVP